MGRGLTLATRRRGASSVLSAAHDEVRRWPEDHPRPRWSIWCTSFPPQPGVGEERPSRSSTTKDDFKRQGEPKIATIRGDERTLIERLQPYNATKVASDNPLAILRKLSNLDKHRLLVTTVAAVSELESGVGSGNAEVRFTFFATGPVIHDAKIMTLTATPEDPTVEMSVHPETALEVHVADTGIVGYRIEAVDLLWMLHHHVRHGVVEMWFRYGAMPPLWTEVEPAP